MRDDRMDHYPSIFRIKRCLLLLCLHKLLDSHKQSQHLPLSSLHWVPMICKDHILDTLLRWHASLVFSLKYTTNRMINRYLLHCHGNRAVFYQQGHHKGGKDKECGESQGMERVDMGWCLSLILLFIKKRE
jgi:hypothetical protein